MHDLSYMLIKASSAISSPFNHECNIRLSMIRVSKTFANSTSIVPFNRVKGKYFCAYDCGKNIHQKISISKILLIPEWVVIVISEINIKITQAVTLSY